jgi:hypothetical protein
MSDGFKLFKMVRAIRNVLGVTALCCLLANTGCGVVALSVSSPTASPVSSPTSSPVATSRIDWGMSLLPNGTVGVGQFPAKFSFDVNAAPDCVRDFVVYNTGVTGSSGSNANIVAFNELYSTQGSVGGLCAQDGPSVYWSYFTGTGRAATSVALSLDGSKVAYVENGIGVGSTATLRVLRWQAGEGSGVDTPAAVDQDISGAPWTACIAGNSCVASIAFNGAAHDTASEPFVDYTNDVIYVGDSTGSLHKFTGVFNGTPAEVTIGWPITVNAIGSLTSPVYDSVSGNIFVGDSRGRLSYVRETNSTVGFCNVGSPPCLGGTSQQVGTKGSIADSPIVDGTNGFVFAVNGTDTLHHGTILQANTALTNPVSFSIGGTSGSGQLYSGAFDQAYFNSSVGSVAGFMYVCGKDPVQSGRPAIYQLRFTSAGVLNSVGTPLLMASTGDIAVCSPITEINNTGLSSASGDWIFFSIGNFAADGAPLPTLSNCRISVDPTTGNQGCLVGINLTNAADPTINPGGTWPPVDGFFTTPGGNNNSNAVALPASNGGSSSGIVVDNVSTASQTSNIYFSLRTSGATGPGLPSCNTTAGVGCAVKLTQSNLN